MHHQQKNNSYIFLPGILGTPLLLNTECDACWERPDHKCPVHPVQVSCTLFSIGRQQGIERAILPNGDASIHSWGYFGAAHPTDTILKTIITAINGFMLLASFLLRHAPS